MKLFLLLAIALGCYPQACRAQTVGTMLPDWYGGGAGFGPHWSSWAALAMPLSQSQAVYSYTLYESVLHKGTVPTTNTTTGLATILRTYKTTRGTLYVFALATAGSSVTSTATTAAFSGGGFALWQFKNGYTAEFLASEQTAGGVVTRTFKLGWGKTFGVK
jgi:hypothetical protein